MKNWPVVIYEKENIEEKQKRLHRIIIYHFQGREYKSFRAYKSNYYYFFFLRSNLP
jgi:hypothetical protein